MHSSNNIQQTSGILLADNISVKCCLATVTQPTIQTEVPTLREVDSYMLQNWCSNFLGKTLLYVRIRVKTERLLLKRSFTHWGSVA